MALFSIIALMPSVQALDMGLYHGTAHVVASGSPQCSVATPTGLGWTWDGILYAYYQNLNFANYNNIQPKVDYDLNAPGWFDVAQLIMTSYQWNPSTGAYVQKDYRFLSTDQNHIGGTLAGASMAIGTQTWKIVVEDYGVNNGNPTCGQSVTFYLYNSANTMTVQILTTNRWRVAPPPCQAVNGDVYRDNVKIGTADINGHFVDHPTVGTHSYYAKWSGYGSSGQTVTTDSSIQLCVVTPFASGRT